jgi:hypothetical protein
MDEAKVLNMLITRRENYGIGSIQHIRGRAYDVVVVGRHYNAIVLANAFSFYTERYHLARHIPDLVICFTHDTVLAIPCLSLKSGRFAEAYSLPENIVDIDRQRHRSKIGSRSLLGMYLCGMRDAQWLIEHLPVSTRKRYLKRARELSKRERGRPVDTRN